MEPTLDHGADADTLDVRSRRCAWMAAYYREQAADPIARAVRMAGEAADWRQAADVARVTGLDLSLDAITRPTPGDALALRGEVP